VVLLLVPAWALAQDGKGGVDIPTTKPETNKNNPANPPAGVRPPVAKSAQEVLPGVPATARDPAPTGTRPVRVDLPGQGEPPVPGAQVPPQAQATAAQAIPNLQCVEGVVTGIDRPGKDLANETIRIQVDPSQTWDIFALGAPARAVRREAARPANGRRVAPAEPAPPAPSANDKYIVPVILTARTYIFAHARTREGADLFGAQTSSSPSDRRARSNELATRAPMPAGTQETNFTNIKVGSFVTVRFRKVGNLNEAVNLNLIELPITAAPAANPAAPPPGAAPPRGTVPAPGTTTAPNSIPPARSVTEDPVPRVPKAPVSPGVIPH
jgi:hypothetical protein